MRPEIGVIEQPVGGNDPHDTHIVEIETLCQHLGPYQDLHPLLLKIGDDLFVGMLSACGIGIHPRHNGIGEEFCHLLLQFFGTCSYRLNALFMADRTFRGRFKTPVAVVAFQLPAIFMVGKGYVATAAFRYPATEPALEHRCKSTPVAEENHLLPRFNALSIFSINPGASSSFIFLFRCSSRVFSNEMTGCSISSNLFSRLTSPYFPVTALW